MTRTMIRTPGGSATALFLLFLLATAGPRALMAQGGGVEAEARAFMERYLATVVSGDGEALADLYHPAGAVSLSSGALIEGSHDHLRAGFTHPDRPWMESVEVLDSAYEVVGPDAAVVLLRLDGDVRPSGAQPAGAEEIAGSYSVLLLRVDGELRIRTEHFHLEPGEGEG